MSTNSTPPQPTATVPASSTPAANPAPAAAPPALTEMLKSLLADWFPVRDRLYDLRTKDDQTDHEAEEVYYKLSELVDIADDIVGELGPDVDARTAITGEISAEPAAAKRASHDG